VTLQVPRLVLGAAQLNQSYGRSGRAAPSDHEVRQLLTLAVELGAAAVDTARGYGGSEAAIGRARASGAGARLPIVTKIRPLTDDDVVTGVGAAVRGSLAMSLRELGTERVETVLLHRAVDMWRAAGTAVQALRSARDDGLLAGWGVSVANPEELLAALAVPDLDYVQLPFNLLDRRWLAAEVLAALSARPEVTVVARSVFLQGILLSRDPSTWPARVGPGAETVRPRLTELAGALGRTVAGLCLGYALAQPWIDAVVVGVRSAAQLAEVARECAEAPLTAGECARVVDLVPAGSPDLVNPASWPASTKGTS
jgi:aryl-alcohol dehydrogenase-like predicted oxidoreductase